MGYVTELIKWKANLDEEHDYIYRQAHLYWKEGSETAGVLESEAYYETFESGYWFADEFGIHIGGPRSLWYKTGLWCYVVVSGQIHLFDLELPLSAKYHTFRYKSWLNATGTTLYWDVWDASDLVDLGSGSYVLPHPCKKFKYITTALEYPYEPDEDGNGYKAEGVVKYGNLGYYSGEDIELVTASPHVGYIGKYTVYEEDIGYVKYMDASHELSGPFFIGTHWYKAIPPTVTTQAVSDIGTTTATGNGNITDVGSEYASAWGVCWKSSPQLETLRPNAAGDESNINSQYPYDEDQTLHWNKVDEVNQDGDSTFVVDASSTYYRDLYALPSHSGSGTINSVTVHAYCRVDDPPDVASLKVVCKTGGVVYEGSDEILTESFALYSKQWTNNPGGGAWTWEQIDALQIGIALKSSHTEAGWSSRCTQVYVVVNYTPIPTIADNTAAGSGQGGTGAFTASMTSLTPVTKYHVRAYATNTEGTGYGADVAFIHVAASVIIGVVATASKSWGAKRVASAIIGIIATASRAMSIVRATSAIIGTVASATKSHGVTKAASVIIGVKARASRIIKVTRSASTKIGVLASAIKSRGFTKTASVVIGVVTSAEFIIGCVLHNLRIITTQGRAYRLKASNGVIYRLKTWLEAIVRD